MLIWLESGMATDLGGNYMTIIRERELTVRRCFLASFIAILAIVGNTACSTQSPNMTFTTWGHEMAHVVCGSFHPQPGHTYQRAYKNVGDWDFSNCREGTYTVRIALYDDLTALQKALSDHTGQVNTWADGWQTREYTKDGWRDVIHVLRPTTDY